MYENRARASDFRRWFQRAGLEVTEFTALRSATIDPALYNRLDPRFKAYETDDLQTVWLMLIAKKPV